MPPKKQGKEPSSKIPKNGRCPVCSFMVHSTGKGNMACKSCGWNGKAS